MIGKLCKTLVFGAILLFLAAPRAHADIKQCELFPAVPWWGNLTHERVIAYVARRHKGDWKSYIDKWDKQADKVEDIYSRGSAIRVTKDKIKVSGEKLRQYVRLLKKRATINRCLAKHVPDPSKFKAS